jgi:5-methylcytosine-specific restriction endonuclease McrA
MRINKTTRELVRLKYDGKCAYCGVDLDDDWQIDHMHPISRVIPKGSGITSYNDISNLMPCKTIINHYKRSLTLNEFRNWYLGGLHTRLKKLPKNPKVAKSIKHKKYLLEVAKLFNIDENTPFSGKFYFETI